MLSNEGKASQIMFEENTLSPTAFDMAALTRLTFLIAVKIIITVTGETCCFLLFFFISALMTGLASKFFMSSLKGELCILIMAKFWLFPTHC